VTAQRRRSSGDGTIYQRADGMWLGAVDLGWQGGKRRRKYVSATTRREVVAKMRPLIRAAEAGRMSPTRTPKVEEWMHTFMNEVAGTAVRPATLSRYEQELRLHVLPEIGHLRLDKVQPHHLSALYRRLLGTLSASSVRRVHALVRRSFNVAVRWGYLASNPAQLVDPPPLPHHEIQPLTVDETRRFLEAARHTPMPARWALAVTLGLRQGEVLGLAWDDIDLDKGVLRVRRALQRQSGGRLVLVQPKTSRSRRTVRMPASLVSLLRDHHERQNERRVRAGGDWEESGLVFTTRTGGAIHPRNDYRAFRALLDRAELRRIRLHDLRHTAASLMLAKEVPARVVMEVLGHSQISLTMNTYSHVADESMQTVAERMEDTLWNRDD
jgi:integrase